MKRACIIAWLLVPMLGLAFHEFVCVSGAWRPLDPAWAHAWGSARNDVSIRVYNRNSVSMLVTLGAWRNEDNSANSFVSWVNTSPFTVPANSSVLLTARCTALQGIGTETDTFNVHASVYWNCNSGDENGVITATASYDMRTSGL